MCIIIDANTASRVFALPCDPDFIPIWKWIDDRDGVMVYGGRHKEELLKLTTVRRRLPELWRAGKAHNVSKKLVDTEEKDVKKLGICRSDDPHIIALARVSGARTLCSNDGDLHDDFKNHRLVAHPRGNVYQTAKHKKLLQHTSSCPART